jgi:squalene-hopene/tetraprenyl-beta-curcumene cyclase
VKRIFLSWTLPAVLLSLLLLTPNTARAADVGPDAKDVQAVVDKALAYLKKQQGENGGFSPGFASPGITALVVAGLIRNGVGPQDPVVAKAMGFLEKTVKKDGGIYEQRLQNYVTSVALLAFTEMNQDGKYDTIIKNATAFLKKLQNEDDEKDVHFGGVGYDGKSRPDMSNTQYFIDALIAAGVPKNDPAIQRALKFISRCQNLPGETNDQPWAKKASEDDMGGFVYNPSPDPKDKRDVTPDGGLRSAGAMTYGGLKSFLYAGVGKDDPRVQGALKWIRKHYTLDENPGMKQAGLYYYYHTFAKAMTALGEDKFKDADGKEHDWRKELFEKLRSLQQENGSFVNKGDRTFGETDANLSTAFALITLSYCKAKK